MMPDNGPACIDLSSGAGGLPEGLEQAGIRPPLAPEVTPAHSHQEGGGAEQPSEVISDYVVGLATEPGRSGLAIIDARTGDGKTYGLADAVARLHALRCGRKVMYLAPRDDNVMQFKRELQGAYERAGVGGELAGSVLALRRSELDLAERVSEMSSCPPGEIRASEEGRAAWEGLVRAQDDLRAFDREARLLHERAAGAARDQLAAEFRWREGAFRRWVKSSVVGARRKALRDALAGAASSRSELSGLVSARLREDFEEGGSLRWVSRLYPASLLPARDVLLMTYDKSLYPCDTIAFGTIYPMTDESLRGSLRVFDEFDAGKQAILRALTRQSADSVLPDLPNLVRHVGAFSEHSGRSWTYLGGHRFGSEAVRSLDRCRDRIVARAKDEIQKWRLDYNFLWVPDQPARAPVIFSDGMLHRIGNTSCVVAWAGGVGPSGAARDANEIMAMPHALRTGVVRAGQPIDRQEANYLTNCMRSLGWTVRNIERSLLMAARVAVEDVPEAGAVSVQSAMRSFADDFGISDTDKRHLVVDAGFDAWFDRWRAGGAVQDDLRSVYTHGFFLVRMSDAEGHARQTRLGLMSLATTPEAILAVVAAQNLVVGASATATHRSVISNYDLGWLESTGACETIRMDEGNALRLRRAQDAIDDGYADGRVAVRASLVGAGCDLEAEWAGLFGGTASAATYYRLATTALPRREGMAFFLARYVRLFKAVRAFVESGAPAGIFWCNAIARSGNPKCDVDVIRQCVCDVASVAGGDPLGMGVFVLTTSTCGGVMGEARDFVADGGRAVILACYTSTGDAMNPVIPKLPGARYAHTGSRPDEGVSDIPFVYLSTPTNVGPTIGPDDAEAGGTGEAYVGGEGLLTYVYDLVALVESGELSSDDFDDSMARVLSDLGGGTRTWMTAGLKRLDSSRGQGYRRVSQAVGRSRRTGVKWPVITLLADEDLCDACSFAAQGPESEPPEMRALRGLLAGAAPGGGDATAALERKAELSSNRCDYAIHYAVSDGWSSDADVERYDLWRRSLLERRRPGSLAEAGASALCWCEVPEGTTSYEYATFGDYEHTVVSFSARDFTERVRSAAAKWGEARRGVVSQRTFRYEQLMSCDEIRDWFEARGLATSFDTSARVWPNPKGANLLLGALGEEAVRALWPHAMQGMPPLSPMPREHFEEFDFAVDGPDGETPAVVVDAKNHATVYIDDGEARAHMAEKATRLGVPGIVMNVLPPAGVDAPSLRTIRDGALTIVPWLWDPVARRHNAEAWATVRSVVREATLAAGGRGIE